MVKEYLTYATYIRTEEKHKWGEVKVIVGNMCIEIKNYNESTFE